LVKKTKFVFNDLEMKNHIPIFQTNWFHIFLFISFISVIISGCPGYDKNSKIDRFSLVTRHNIEISKIDSLNSLSVGNGEFAFTTDITGLQTFPGYYSRGIPLGTMSNWGWHTGDNPSGYKLSDVYKKYEVHGREVNYVHLFRGNEDSAKTAASEWLRNNPHRIHLGMIGLQIIKEDGSEIKIGDIIDPVQNLDLWTGMIKSRFTVENTPVEVITVCHPDKDLVSVSVTSNLIKERRLKIRLSFPLGVSSPLGYDFDQPNNHLTKILSDSGNETLFERKQDNDIYYVKVYHENAPLKVYGKHLFYLDPAGDSGLEFSCHFSKNIPEGITDRFSEVVEASRKSWSDFWNTGGAVDFSACSDPRAFELERRVVLSQYLTKIECSGSLPPAETGLTYNSWYGKFHLEMHWWHAVHFALWQRDQILERQMDYYRRIYDNARQTAQNQGYKGIRWPKMVGPDGRESPSTVGTYLIWQQPHVIFFSELLYENSKDREEILKKYKDLVFATADFMASYAWYDTKKDRFVLGPVLIPAQESLKLETTINPPFELTYWYWGLKTAQQWRSRMKLDPDPQWADVLKKISDLPALKGLYLCSEDTEDSYLNERYLRDHPIVSAVSGMLPKTNLVDNKILSCTLDTIQKKWNWQSAWGWDFPMLAMSAASVGRSEQAIDFLMMDVPKNRYLANGHNYQDARLAIYLPGNGGLLTAVAKMCIGEQFPVNGKWKVKYENLNGYVK
jgi:protein-glucosylgalactosylhydroxylysine glucosidase